MDAPLSTPSHARRPIGTSHAPPSCSLSAGSHNGEPTVYQATDAMTTRATTPAPTQRARRVTGPIRNPAVPISSAARTSTKIRGGTSQGGMATSAPPIARASKRSGSAHDSRRPLQASRCLTERPEHQLRAGPPSRLLQPSLPHGAERVSVWMLMFDGPVEDRRFGVRTAPRQPSHRVLRRSTATPRSGSSNRAAGAPSTMSWSNDTVRQRCSRSSKPPSASTGRLAIAPTATVIVALVSGTSHSGPEANIPTAVTPITPNRFLHTDVARGDPDEGPKQETPE